LLNFFMFFSSVFGVYFLVYTILLSPQRHVLRPQNADLEPSAPLTPRFALVHSRAFRGLKKRPVPISSFLTAKRAAKG
jgi:hypothetical protein